ncbi:unnamed protein product [Rotaria sp. Silwood2]|nr:unnamed protein product [Rotaria sp. Silwood2]
MSEINIESSTTESVVILSEASSTPTLSSTSSSNTVDDEARRRKILSKLWGKGNKLSHKVRELDKSTISNSSDSFVHNDNEQKQLGENPNNHLAYSSTNDPKSSIEDSSNSINSSKPLAVVKPIVVKSGLIVSSSTDRTRLNSEASSTTITQIDEITTITVTERLASSTTTDRTSDKKKKSHKNKDLKKKKTTKDQSVERDRLHHHHHQTDKTKKNSSSSKNNRQEQNEEISTNDNNHKSLHHHSSSTISLSKNNRRSPSDDIHHANRQSSRSTTSRKDEFSSAKRSTLSPVDYHRNHSNSKYESSSHYNYSSHRHRRGSSVTLSPSPPSRSHHSTLNKDQLQRKNSSSPKKDERNSTTQIKSNRQQSESISNSKSTNTYSPSDLYSKPRHRRSDTTGDDDTHRYKTRTSDENLTNSSKSQKSLETSPEHHYHRSSSSFVKQEKSKTIQNNDNKNELNQEKSYLSRHERRSYSRHRSKSKENKTNRKPIEPSSSDDGSNHQHKANNEKNSTTINENLHMEKKSNHQSSIPSSNNDHRRKSSSDYHRYDRHDSPLNYDRKNDYRHHHHRIPSSHSYYPHTHYVHHHHHHHYRSKSSRYYDRRRSISPRSHQHRSRYYSSTSSSLSPSPRRRRRNSSRTSSSTSRSSSSYSSISRTSSSRSSSRHNHYYHHEKKFRRSPTLEKIFLKASESIESISTQKNPNISSSSSSTHLIPIQTSNIPSDMQISSTINSLSETNTFYSENFTGFSIPPPPFISQSQQRCLKEITTEPTTQYRPVLNEVQTIQSSTSITLDEVIPIKTVQSNDVSSNVRSGSSKPPRISRFSDIAPSVTSEPILNTNLPVDTYLNYTQINENINCLPSSRRQQKRHNREVMECECTTSEYDRSRGVKACGHECLNRMLLIECGPICPCGQWCTNRRFQRRSYANHKLALFKTEMKGHGLRTITQIRKGRFLVEYIGEVIDMDELARRNKKYKRDGNTHQYVMSLIHGTVIDSTIKGNWARFINHSCEPNCVAEKWLVNGEYRMGIFAKRDLNINEEITIDYRFETFGTSDLTNEKCYCGASTCRGTISIKNNNNNNLNQRQNRRQPLDDDDILNYLLDDDTNEYIIPKTIDDVRQLIQIMSRTDSENVRTIELDLIKNSSQKQFALPRLFLECDGLHVLCSWMKDILIDDDEQQYSNEFKYRLLDFIHSVLPIKDRTTVIKNGLLDLVYKKLKLSTPTTDNIDNNDQEQINNLMNSILNHLDDPIISKLFHLYSTWMSLKERYIIPKRKEPEQPLNHHHRHHHHHHHHSSKYQYEETNSRFNFSTRSSEIQQKPNDRSFGRRSFVVRETPRTQEQQLSKDERRKLFEQQYEDAEKARVVAAAAAANEESPGLILHFLVIFKHILVINLGVQSEPPQKKQRTSDNTEPMVPSTPPQPQSSSMPTTIPWIFSSNAIYPHQIDQTFWIHQHLSQIPIDYIRSYMASIGQPISVSNASIDKDEPPLPPPPKPDNENELSRITYLPSGWSVAMCPSDSSIYFYNRKTMATSWIPPSLTVPIENSVSLPPPPPPPLDLSPLSSAQIHEQRRPHHDQQQVSSSSRSSMKLLKQAHRHSRSYRHHHHNMSINNKRKRPVAVESITIVKEELHSQMKEETSIIISNEQFKQDENNDKNSVVEHTEEMSVDVPKVSTDGYNENNVSITVKESSEINDNVDKQHSSDSNTLSSSSKINRDLLRKNISQHVHATLKPYTKRTCKQGRIVSTDDIKYLVKKFTLAVLDKEIEKAKNDGTSLSPVLTDRVRLKTEVYVKKYMNKMGTVFQRHDTTVHPPPQPSQQTTTTTSNPE